MSRSDAALCHWTPGANRYGQSRGFYIASYSMIVSSGHHLRLPNPSGRRAACNRKLCSLGWNAAYRNSISCTLATRNCHARGGKWCWHCAAVVGCCSKPPVSPAMSVARDAESLTLKPLVKPSVAAGRSRFFSVQCQPLEAWQERCYDLLSARILRSYCVDPSRRIFTGLFC